MQKTTKISLVAIALVTAIVSLAASAPVIFAQSSGGQYNPQTQFPVGTRLTFTSFNGLGRSSSRLQCHHGTKLVSGYSASAVINAQVDKLTRDGGIHCTVTGGSFIINGETYTITGGHGHMGMFDRVASGMDGYAAGPNGQTYQES